MTQELQEAMVLPLDRASESFAVQLFTALGHPTRLRIVSLLTAGERTVGEVAQALELLQPNASQHLAILTRAGVLKVRPDGAARCYGLRECGIGRIMALVNEFRDFPGAKV